MFRVELRAVSASRPGIALDKGRAHQNDTLSKFSAEQIYADVTISAKNVENTWAPDKMRRIQVAQALTLTPCHAATAFAKTNNTLYRDCGLPSYWILVFAPRRSATANNYRCRIGIYSGRR
jgi:hypothetical protein